jgi:hypothetical protein
MYYHCSQFLRERHDTRIGRQTHQMLSYVSPEQHVRAAHPLRAIRAMTDWVFADLSPPAIRTIRHSPRIDRRAV